MKAVILAAGYGKRLQPITNQCPKVMIPIFGKPFITYLIDEIRRFGIEQIFLVTGYKREQIKKYFKDLSYNSELVFLHQKNREGTAHALDICKKYIKNEKFLLFLGDTIIPDLTDYLERLTSVSAQNAILSAKITENLQNVGTLEIKNGNIKKILEKSRRPRSNIAWAGCGIFNYNIFDYIEKTETRLGEYSLTDTINIAINEGVIFKNIFCKEFIDIGTHEGLYRALKYFFKYHNEEKCCSKLKIGKSVNEPCHIGKNCQIGNNVSIGPYVSIEDGVTINDDVSISNSLILNDSIINKNEIISRAIIQKRWRVKI